MLNYLHTFVVPAAYSVLPLKMNSPASTAMLLAIALQESKCCSRRQLEGGPARGFWQFETAGISGVRLHPASSAHLDRALVALCYASTLTVKPAQQIVEHNDVLACVYARLLLYTLPTSLPDRTEVNQGWAQYLDAWRPGKPIHHTWPANFARAWALVG